MIGSHCGKRVVTISWNKFYFRVRCVVCRKVFTQHKRRAAK